MGQKGIVLAKYSNFANVFSKKSVNTLPEQTGANKYTIELEKDKLPSFEPINGLELAELEIFKIYIETNLANGFIQA